MSQFLKSEGLSAVFWKCALEINSSKRSETREDEWTPKNAKSGPSFLFWSRMLHDGL